MMYNMTEEAKTIATIKGITLKEVAKLAGVYFADYKEDNDDLIASNRFEQNCVLDLLSKVKEEEAKKERLSAFHWVKEDGEWVVAGDFSGKEVGSAITVVKVNGEKQEKTIVLFTSTGNANVEDFVPSSSKEEVEEVAEVAATETTVSEVSEVAEEVVLEVKEVSEVEKIEEKLRTLLDGPMTSYEIAKKSGVTISMVDRYRKGENLLENITLKTAKKIFKIIEKNT